MKKILVIDDAEFILESTSTLLSLEGYDVVTANNGLEGVEKANVYKPDLILCDISMPKLDGYGVLDKIRTNNETSTTPFIFLTAFNEKANMRAGMEKGADDFIVKPYTRSELIAAINAQWKKSDKIKKHVQEKVDQVGRNVTYALPHEFRTALNQIVNSAKFMNQNSIGLSKDEIMELSHDIISSSERLMKITENYLAYVKLEALFSNEEKSRELVNFRTPEPSPVVYDIAYLMADRYGRLEDLELNGDVEDLSIKMSTENFHKMLNELLDNAFKFSEAGTKVKIDLKIDGDKLILEIKDSGRGMTEEQIKNVGALMQFERTIYEQQGVGLGLAIAKKIVLIHQGDFLIESNGKDYTYIKLLLPFEYNS